jgi:hypothetical protein
MSPFQGVTTKHLFATSLSCLSIDFVVFGSLSLWVSEIVENEIANEQGEVIKVASVMLHWWYLYEFIEIVQHIFYKKMDYGRKFSVRALHFDTQVSIVERFSRLNIALLVESYARTIAEHDAP